MGARTAAKEVELPTASRVIVFEDHRQMRVTDEREKVFVVVQVGGGVGSLGDVIESARLVDFRMNEEKIFRFEREGHAFQKVDGIFG